MRSPQSAIDSDENVLVIGAGPAGLAVSACLRRSGVAHLVVDRGDSPGSSWRGHYDRLHLHTPKKHSGLPFTPWPREAPRYPSRDEVVRYLEDYAEEHHVAPRFGLEVRRVARSDRGFEVETSGGVLRPRAVVVASGYNGVANRPDFPGLGRFAGPVIHSSRYRNPQPYLGKRTLVVGCGNSGAEIALDLAEHGVTTSMVVRGPVHVVPRDLFGRPTQETALLLARLPRALRDAMAAAVLRIAVGDLSRWGIVRPQATPDQMIASEGRIPMLDIGTIAMVKAGRITVMPAVEEILPDRVRFRCGRSETFDAIILATGYRPGLERFVDGFAEIGDSRGRPHAFGEETRIPGLFFVGFRNTATGLLREIGIEAERVAASIRSRLRI